MATTDGRIAKGNLTRDQVLAPALDMATNHGLHGFSLGEVAEHSGVQKGSIQQLFKDKSGLHLAIVNRAKQDARERILIPAGQPDDGVGRLATLGERWMKNLATSGGGAFLTSAWARADATPGPARDALVEEYNAWRSGLEGSIKLGRKNGQLTGGATPKDEATVFMAMALGAGAAFRLTGERAALNRAAKAWVRQIDRLR